MRGALKIAKNMGIQNNVTIRVLDANTFKVVSEHVGHNQATNSLLTGLAHYLTGDGILNQASSMLGKYIPRYISLGTMGLTCQGMDTDTGLPTGIGDPENDSDIAKFNQYIAEAPGYGADGYDSNDNNGRNLLGLGTPFYYNNNSNLNCELVSPSFPRATISYREIVPENKAETAHSIDIVYSAMISTGALAQFRDKVAVTNSSDTDSDTDTSTNKCSSCSCSNCNCNCGTNSDADDSSSTSSSTNEKDVGYIFITEAGLWSKQVDFSEETWKKYPNGLLAGYRLIPPDAKTWDMSEAENRTNLLKNIICVRTNQIVQVIWKIQLISVGQTDGLQVATQILDKCKDIENTINTEDTPNYEAELAELISFIRTGISSEV